jgi:hypothetical protein
MIKYKIVSTVVEHLDEEVVEETLRLLQDQNPDKKLEVLKYNWSTGRIVISWDAMDLTGLSALSKTETIQNKLAV